MQYQLLDNSTITIRFNKPWDYEQIPELIKIIMAATDNVHVIEKTSGADRQYLRFEWCKHIYLLHFESYSQSSWIEAENELGRALISELYANMNSV